MKDVSGGYPLAPGAGKPGDALEKRAQEHLEKPQPPAPDGAGKIEVPGK